MVTIQDVRENREDILRICREHGGSNVRLFGSVVRGEQTQNSDIDMLVELAEDRSLLDRIAIKHGIEKGCRFYDLGRSLKGSSNQEFKRTLKVFILKVFTYCLTF